MQAFEQEEWVAPQDGGTLSLDGTDVFLQMRYAATLLHDVRTGDEGIQRLASLADAGNLRAKDGTGGGGHGCFRESRNWRRRRC